MTSREFIKLLAQHYADRNDLEVVSIGHWKDADVGGLPHFYADVAVSVREIRQMAGKD